MKLKRREQAKAPVVHFEQGTLVVRGPRQTGELLAGLPECRLDPRAGGGFVWRLPACRYRELLTRLHRSGEPYQDEARAYEPLELELEDERQPRPHQAEALAAWLEAGKRGVVVLPTGSGKTFLGLLAIDSVARSTLVITPTLDLVAQWAEQLERAFPGTPVGVIGGGSHDPQPLTVCTYASAHRKMEHLGDRYGLLIFDEVHHLPGSQTSWSARGALAPFRLGLTATLEREDGKHRQLDEMVGPLVCKKGIEELSGAVLAPYRVELIEVELTDEERETYERERAIYLDFIRERGLRVGSRAGWQQFLREAASSPEGRRAYQGHRNQRRVTQHAANKLLALEQLLERHPEERIIIFTADNRTVYEICRRFLVPGLTHQTKVAERKELLARFGDGSLPVLATSQVLNEGVDVPEASIGVVLSGSGSVREHVQRLGRILRRQAGKQAILYEILTADTAERFTSDRRREHPAYQAGSGGQPGAPPAGAPANRDEAPPASQPTETAEPGEAPPASQPTETAEPGEASPASQPTETADRGEAPPASQPTETSDRGEAPPASQPTATSDRGEAPPASQPTATSDRGEAPPASQPTATSDRGEAPPASQPTETTDPSEPPPASQPKEEAP